MKFFFITLEISNPFENDLKAHVTVDAVRAAMKLAVHIATIGIGEGHEAHGFTIIVGASEELMSKDDDGYPNFGEPASRNPFQDADINLCDVMGHTGHEDMRYVVESFGGDGAHIVDGISGKVVAAFIAVV